MNGEKESDKAGIKQKNVKTFAGSDTKSFHMLICS